MTGKTTIEWTAMPGYVGAVWNPTTGCTRVSAGCDNSAVVAAPIATRTAFGIEQVERRSASAGALDQRIGLVGETQHRRRLAMVDRVRVTTRGDDQILRSIVRLVPIQMMHLLALPKCASDRSLSDKSMLVHVATRVGSWMAGSLHKYVSVGGDRATALPVRVLPKRELALAQWHSDSVAPQAVRVARGPAPS